MEGTMKTVDIALIGGGIVGVSTAWQLKQRYPDAAILLLEKESSLAFHQTGHNSGVIHAGVYYQPGSLKADFCKRGASLTMEFCREHSIPYEKCGKLLVATDAVEFERLTALEERCRQNGIDTHRLTRAELRAYEPQIIGDAAFLVPATGITDYKQITAKMAELFVTLGGEIEYESAVHTIDETSGRVIISTGNATIEAKYLVACGGLMADRLARLSGIAIDFQIVPFRGEYYRLPDRHNQIVSHLIYPIPDPDLPFLGVHLTRMIDGFVTVGPNAVLGWKREGYNEFNFDLHDSMEMLSFPGFWKVMYKNVLSGIAEMKDSLLKSGYLSRIQKYCPGLVAADLQPYPAGIRAQAVRKNGSLVHDFLFVESERSFHVCNAPSPAATSAMPIGEYICHKVTEKFKL